MENSKEAFERLLATEEGSQKDEASQNQQNWLNQTTGSCGPEKEVRQERMGERSHSAFGRWVRRAAPIAAKVLLSIVSQQTGLKIETTINRPRTESPFRGSNGPGPAKRGLQNEESILFI
jgi:hypothetical protein